MFVKQQQTSLRHSIGYRALRRRYVEENPLRHLCELLDADLMVMSIDDVPDDNSRSPQSHHRFVSMEGE
jgi:hypothetical protein